MKKLFRVSNKLEFQAILNNRKSLNSDIYRLSFQRKSSKYCRFGIAISSKLANAVMRNKVKRQIRMMLQRIISPKLNHDYVVIVKKAYFQHDYQSNYLTLVKMVDKIERKNN